MPKPRKLIRDVLVSVTVRMLPGTKSAIRKLAKTKRLKPSEYMRFAIEDKLKADTESMPTIVKPTETRAAVN